VTKNFKTSEPFVKTVIANSSSNYVLFYPRLLNSSYGKNNLIKSRINNKKNEYEIKIKFIINAGKTYDFSKSYSLAITIRKWFSIRCLKNGLMSQIS